MTVCIAAIANNNMILAMADRMLTGALVQYQPGLEKIVAITSSIVALTSFDNLVVARELIDTTRVRVHAGIDANPNEWWKVADAAEMFRAVVGERQLREAEAQYLKPIGLTADTFLARQRELDPAVAADLTGKLTNFRLPSVSVIFAGLDATGAHIFVAQNSKVECHDAIGYAAIGSGAFHALSQFIVSNHLPTDPIQRALYTTYVAKRRAEVAPGVGEQTDHRLIYALGTTTPIRDEIVEVLASEYAASERKKAKHNEQTYTKVKTKIDAIVNQPPATVATQVTPMVTPTPLPTPTPAVSSVSLDDNGEH